MSTQSVSESEVAIKEVESHYSCVLILIKICCKYTTWCSATVEALRSK